MENTESMVDVPCYTAYVCRIKWIPVGNVDVLRDMQKRTKNV